MLGCQSGLVVDIGSHESRAMCVAYGRPLLATFVASPIGVNQASSRFHRFLISNSISPGTEETNSSESSSDCLLDPAFTAMLFEKTAVAVAGPSSEQAADVIWTDREKKGVRETVTVPGWLRQDCLKGLIEGDWSDEGM